MTEHKTAEQLADEIKAAQDAVKEIAEEALGKAKSGEQVTNSLKEKADEAISKINLLSQNMKEVEQFIARSNNDSRDLEKSLGNQFVEDEKVKSFLDNSDGRGKVDVSIKAPISSSTTDAAGSAGAAIDPMRKPGIIQQADRRLTIRGLLMQGRMDSSAIEYVKETGFSNNADTVAERALKPESDIKLELVLSGAKVIAHTVKASRQILDDVPQLMSYIDGRLRYGLAFREELQILNGDGTGQNLHGIIPQATGYNPSFTVDVETPIDKIRLAILQSQLAEYPADGIVLNPIDWARIETAKDADGRYIIGNPQNILQANLWGLPVVSTQAIQPDKFLSGSFSMGAQIYDRWQSRVELATQNEDDFKRNMVTLLAEERLALAVYRPESFIYGDFGNVSDPAGA